MCGEKYTTASVRLHWSALKLNGELRHQRRRLFRLEAIAAPTDVQRDALRLVRLNIERIEAALDDLRGRDHA